MRISPISYYNQTFGTNKRIIDGKPNTFNEDGISQSTCICREDLDWDGLMLFLPEHFNDKRKVNVYCAGCSDGSEAYSFVINAKQLPYKNTYDKFLPVKAFDNDNYIIDVAKSGYLNLIKNDFVTMSFHSIVTKRYFELSNNQMQIENDSLKDESITFKVSNILKDNVKFSCKDMKQVLSKLKDNGNTVFMCRNVFQYLSDDEIEKIIYDAGEKFKKGSVFIIGKYDSMYTNTDRYLVNNDFEEVLDYVYVKR